MKVKMLFTQLRPTLCHPMDYSPPGSSVHRIFQAKNSSGLSFPSPGYLLNPGLKPRSLALPADSLPSEPSIINKVVGNCFGIINSKLRIQNIYHLHYTQMSYIFSERRDGPLMKPPLKVWLSWAQP